MQSDVHKNIIKHRKIKYKICLNYENIERQLLDPHFPFSRTFAAWKLSAPNAAFGPKAIRQLAVLAVLTFTLPHKSGPNPIRTFRHPALPNLTSPCFT